MANSKKSSKPKRASILFKMVSSADTGYFYTARRNTKKKTDKMQFRKYDPVAKKHVIFKEKKLSS